MREAEQEMICTERLLLRQWRAEDRDPFARMGQDLEVMEFFPSLLTREESDAGADRAAAYIAANGCGFWAVEIPGEAEFDHPGFEEGHRLRRHVLYRITKAGWRSGDKTGATPLSPIAA